MILSRPDKEPTRAKDDKKGRGSIMLRQWQILGLIRRTKQGISARELSCRLETPYRTIMRDLDVLVHVTPIYCERTGNCGHSGYRNVWKITDNDVF